MHELREYQRLQLVLFMWGGRPRPPLLTLTNMKREAQFVICIGNKSYPASLESRKIYQIIPDKVAARLHQIRVIDESGRNTCTRKIIFVPARLPQAVERAVRRATA